MSLNAKSLKQSITQKEFNNLRKRKFVIQDRFTELLKQRSEMFAKMAKRKKEGSKETNVGENISVSLKDSKLKSINRSSIAIEPLYKVVPKNAQLRKELKITHYL